ncbi:MAG: hypothetical protein AAGB93_19865 [Planctomycetota bacterium]
MPLSVRTGAAPPIGACLLLALVGAPSIALSSPTSPAAPAPQCGEDGLEDNDTCATALPIAVPFVEQGLVVYKTDPDYYTVDVPPGEEIRVDVFFTHAVADIDLYLYDRNGSCGGIFDFLERSISSDDDERIVWQNVGSTTVEVALKVEVFPGSIPVCNTYDITLDVEAPVEPCDAALLDDALEDNDTCATAVPLPLGLTRNLWASRNDEDFYAATLFAGETLAVDIFFDDSETDLDLFLYDATGPCGGGPGSGELVAGFTQTDDESIVWTNASGVPRDVIVHVDVWNFDDCNDYVMQVAVTGGGIGTNYCTAVPNSSGLVGLMQARGTTSAAANDITLRATQLPPSAFGFFLNSRTPGFTAGPGGSAGNLCLGGSIGRFDAQIVNSGPTGKFEIQIDLTQIPSPTGAVQAAAGETWRFQAWFRDSVGGMPTSNLTNGLRIVLTP